MALKADRQEWVSDIHTSCESVQSEGVLLSFTSHGSGNTIGDTKSKADAAANPSGQKVAGLLMNPVINPDTANWSTPHYSIASLKGNPCHLMKKGRVVTDNVVGTPTNQGAAYLGNSGAFEATQATGAPQVGYFDGIKDANGFVPVIVDLPK